LITTRCGFSCHGGDRMFQRRYDERGWRLILDRMTNHGQRILITTNPRTPTLTDEAETLVKFLTRVRGPDSPTPPIVPFNRPKGPATRAIITEYELPWTLVNIHDVHGDAQGHIYFNINRSPLIGRLDPQTGQITEYRIPQAPEPPLNDPRDRYLRADGTTSSPTGVFHRNPPGVHPGLHWLQVDHNTGRVWFTDSWSRSLGMLDPKTGEAKSVFTGMQGNVGLSPDGKSIWRSHKGKILQFDTATVLDTGRPVRTWDLKHVNAVYGNFLSPDGRYFGGGAGWIVWLDTKTGEVREIPLEFGNENGRGTFDNEGNIWTGTETLNKYDPRTNALTMYMPPTPYFCAYSARADKNGEIWSGQQQSGRVFRFNPKTHRWIEYVMPNPWSHDFAAWIDNSTSPPTFWYGDQHGYIVRVQPLE
jgi:streptogramin lyase